MLFLFSILQLGQSKETSHEVKLDLFNNILEFYKDKSLFELGCPNCLYQNFTFIIKRSRKEEKHKFIPRRKRSPFRRLFFRYLISHNRIEEENEMMQSLSSTYPTERRLVNNRGAKNTCG